MRNLLLACIAALLFGCAGNPFTGYDVAPGTPRDAVIARMGQPQRVVPLPTGERLQYSLQPLGRYAWMVDLDASGKVVQARQVLNARRLQPDRTGQVDARRRGARIRPAGVDRSASPAGTGRS